MAALATTAMKSRRLARPPLGRGGTLTYHRMAVSCASQQSCPAMSAYCSAYAHWQKAEEALQRSGELTIKTTKGHPRVNPLVRIASQAMDDMRRIGAEFGLSPNARLRLSSINAPPSPSKFDGLLK